MVNKFRLDFVGIGGQKSATDWVSECLGEHPEIYFSRPREIHFFSDYDPHLLSVENFRYNRGLSWYKKHFSHYERGLKGEFTPTYMYSKKTAERIKKHFPEVKIIVSLRDPVERAFSQYIFDKRIGLIKNISFEEAVRKHDSYLEKGLYYKYLSYYYKLFARKQILVFLVDDIKTDPKKVIKACYEFLGLRDTDFTPGCLHKKSNAAKQTIFPAFNYFLLHTEFFLKNKGYKFLLNTLEDLGIRKLAVWLNYRLNQKPLKEYPKLRKETARRLRLAYVPDIIKLEKLLERDLSFWKNEKQTF